MKISGIVTISVLAVFTLALFIIYMCSRRPLRTAGINMLLGIAALAAVDLSARFTGVYIPINIYTLPGSAVFGIPAVCAFVVLQMIF